MRRSDWKETPVEVAEPVPLLKVAVAIPTYLREEPLLDTIQQVLAQDPRPDELLVIDQTPRHEKETHDSLLKWNSLGDIRWIRQAEPSLTKARNRAVLETNADIIAFLDDDVLINKNWLSSHVRHYECPTVSAVGGEVYQRTGDCSRVDIRDPNRETVPSFELSEVSLSDFLVGANFSVRKEHFISVGGFDEAFVGSANFEENDFIQRLIRTGGVILADPDAWVIHLRVPSGGCRITGNPVFPEWTKSYNYFLYAFRHVRKTADFVEILKNAIRVGPLRAENRSEPSRWPRAWASFLWGMFRALAQANKAPKSPWEKTANELSSKSDIASEKNCHKLGNAGLDG